MKTAVLLLWSLALAGVLVQQRFTDSCLELTSNVLWLGAQFVFVGVLAVPCSAVFSPQGLLLRQGTVCDEVAGSPSFAKFARNCLQVRVGEQTLELRKEPWLSNTEWTRRVAEVQALLLTPGFGQSETRRESNGTQVG